MGRRGPAPTHPTYRTAKGVVMVWDETRYVREHRAVMAKKLGRKLRPDELVFHHDEDFGNNDPGNLFVVTRSEIARGWLAVRRKAGEAALIADGAW